MITTIRVTITAEANNKKTERTAEVRLEEDPPPFIDDALTAHLEAGIDEQIAAYTAALVSGLATASIDTTAD